MFPLARTDKLSIRELPQETVVYDLETHKVHCLNGTSALIWKHCDGRTSIAALARIVQEAQGCDAPLAVVQLALEQLSGRSLLRTAIASATGPARVSRRDALKKLAAAAVAIPVIMSMAAPKAHASMSARICFGVDAFCSAGGVCQTGRCVTSGSPGAVIEQCVYTNKPNGTPCGSAATCQNGACVRSESPGANEA